MTPMKALPGSGLALDSGLAFLFFSETLGEEKAPQGKLLNLGTITNSDWP